MQDVKAYQAISVSVVMCTYNGEKFIEEQLLSVVNQTYPLKEVLIFDDTSTDNTVNIIQKIAAGHPVIRLLVNETNLGYTRNFEQGLKAATGDAIAISDQDDVWMLDKVEKLVKAWKPEYPLIYCSSYFFSGKPPETLDINPNFRRFEGKDARKIFLYNSVSGHALLIRRSFLQLVLPLNEKVTYDWWMAVVAAYNGGVQYFPEILVCQRLHDNNVTVAFENRYSKDEIRLKLKQTIIDNCNQFAEAINIPKMHKAFALKLARLAAESLNRKFYFPLFLFLLNNRTILFNYKKRKVAIFSHVKHSYRRTAG